MTEESKAESGVDQEGSTASCIGLWEYLRDEIALAKKQRGLRRDRSCGAVHLGIDIAEAIADVLEQHWRESSARSPSSPPSRGSEEELGKLLSTLMREAREDGLADFADADDVYSGDTFRARQSVESYISRLRDERPIPAQISEAIGQLEKAAYHEGELDKPPKVRGEGRTRIPLIDSPPTAGMVASDETASARVHLEELFLASDRMTRYWMREAESLQAALASLKEQQLTAREASAIIDDVERRYFPHNAEHLFSGIAKLRLLSTSDSEQK